MCQGRPVTPPKLFFIKKVEKNVAKENLRDRFGSEIFPRECYLKEFYFQKNRSENSNIKEFFILNYEYSNDAQSNV